MSRGTKVSAVRIAPNHYVHVLNRNSHITSLVVGPRTYICLEHEEVVLGATKMVCLSTSTYCVISDPVIRDTKGNASMDAHGQAMLRLGDEEYRFSQNPFALYPGEKMKGSIMSLPVVLANNALRLSALVSFTEDDGVDRIAGEEWLFEGPGSYYPRKEVTVVKKESAEMIKPNTAIRLRARRDCMDRNGIKRIYGEEWLVKVPGVYLPTAYEECVEVTNAYLITEKTALHLKAIRTFVDDYGKQRKVGEEWLITSKDSESHICSVNEEVVNEVDITTLSTRDYCVILDPVDENGVPQLGTKRLVIGEKSFFLQPGERLEAGVQSIYVLTAEEGLIIQAQARFEDDMAEDSAHKVIRLPGEMWLLRGPIEYVPPVTVQVIERRSLIPLSRNEGIYVRNIKTGHVRAVIGEAYMLSHDEELWHKKLPSDVIEQLDSGKDPLSDRGAYNTLAAYTPKQTDTLDLTRVVSLQVPHNAAVQVYDYRNKKARVEFGPDLVLLQPDEQFTLLSLSGGKPKRPNVIKSLCLLLGPDFCTDMVVVETADHARLSLQLSYNWQFDVSSCSDASEASKLFSVPDFVGDACKAIASRIRGTVASVKFDDFHKHSSRIIRTSVFGLDENGKVRNRFIFTQNNLHITSIDVQSVDPVDQRTRDALQKSVQLAIEITTSSQEAAARHEAARLEQEAQGKLERQRIKDEAAAEQSRRNLVELRVESAALESTGQAKAEAVSRAEAARIEGQAAVEQADLHAQASAIETKAELSKLTKAREAELQYQEQKNALDINLRKEQVELEVKRFTAMVSSVGADTLRLIAAAGPEQDIRMLKSLGLHSTLITDGKTPVNLLSTAHGLIGNIMNGVTDGKGSHAIHTRPIHAVTGGEASKTRDYDDDDSASTMS